MKKFSFAFFAQFLFLALLTCSTAKAQEPKPFPPPGDGVNPPLAAQDDKAGEPLFRQLNLTLDQIKQIREINRTTRPTMREAAQKQRDARRALDFAIYAQNPNEQEVEKRAREFGEAQAELSKLKARTEFHIRQILNKDQLARFIQLRRDIEENKRERRQEGFPPPLQRRQLGKPLGNKRQF